MDKKEKLYTYEDLEDDYKTGQLQKMLHGIMKSIQDIKKK